MNSNFKKLASEQEFKSFMTLMNDIVDLDIIANKIPKNTKIADYAINNLFVLELKVLKSDPKLKIDNYCYKLMERSDFPSIYGTMDMRHVTSLMKNGEGLIRDIENKAFRQVESILSKANKQISSTIHNVNMSKHSHGVLVIINEEADFFEPDVLVSYIYRKLTSRKNNQFRFKNISQVILIQDTHKTITKAEEEKYIPIYSISNNLIKPNSTSLKAISRLNKLFMDYTFNSNHKYVEANDYNGSMNVKEIKTPSERALNFQEVIEERYRNERYMKNFSEDELIEFGSKVISVFTAMFLKVNPLILEPRDKMIFLKAFIELLEECRLRPFDMRNLKLDTNVRLDKSIKSK